LKHTITKTHPIKHYYYSAPLPTNTILEAKPQRLQHSKNNGTKTPFCRLRGLKRDLQTTTHFEESLTSTNDESQGTKKYQRLNSLQKRFHSELSHALKTNMYFFSEKIYFPEIKPSFLLIKKLHQNSEKF